MAAGDAEEAYGGDRNGEAGQAGKRVEELVERPEEEEAEK